MSAASMPGPASAQPGREFWRGVLLGGGSTIIPRWTLDPVAGFAEHVTPVDAGVVTALGRLTQAMEVPFSTVLLVAHAKVLAALAGESEVVTGYVATPGCHPLPCQLSTAPKSWRALLLQTHRVESLLLSHQDFPVRELAAELGLAEPPFETVLD